MVGIGELLFVSLFRKMYMALQLAQITQQITVQKVIKAEQKSTISLKVVVTEYKVWDIFKASHTP